MRKILFLLLAAITISCSPEEPKICCTVIDSYIDIKILDEEGNNLLASDDSYFSTNILTYNRIGEEWKISRDIPRIIEREDGNYLRVFANLENPEENISELKLQFSATDFDLIKTEIARVSSNIIVTKVWYNGELRWAQEDKTERIIEVRKT